MLGHNTSNIEFFPRWTCPHCNKENDITNMVRCYNCNEKKPTPAEIKEILAKKAQKEAKQHQETSQKKDELIKVQDDDFDSQDTNQVNDLEFDLSKLETEDQS